MTFVDSAMSDISENTARTTSGTPTGIGGRYSALPTPAQIQARSACVEEAQGRVNWTLLPESKWENEFMPRYVNEHGQTCDGSPWQPEDDDECFTLLPYTEFDPEDDEPHHGLAVANELLVDFRPGTRPCRVREIVCRFGLEILYADFDPPTPGLEDPEAWFHLGTRPDSAYYNCTRVLVSELPALPDIDEVSFNDVAPPAARLFECEIDGVRRPRDVLLEPDSSGVDDRAMTRLKIAGADCAGAWHDDAADMGGEHEDVTVVVMDTGVAVDHEDFQYGYDEDGQPIAASQAPAAPRGRDRDPYKAINTRWNGCAHGTVVAGVIAAATDDEVGTVSCGAPYVKVMSATLRLGHHYAVSVGSMIKAVKKGNDRLWIAPAGFDGQHEKPTKTVRNKTVSRNLPTVLGVTGVDWPKSQTQPGVAEGTNFASHGALESRESAIYGISAYEYGGYVYGVVRGGPSPRVELLRLDLLPEFPVAADVFARILEWVTRGHERRVQRLTRKVERRARRIERAARRGRFGRRDRIHARAVALVERFRQRETARESRRFYDATVSVSRQGRELGVLGLDSALIALANSYTREREERDPRLASVTESLNARLTDALDGL